MEFVAIDVETANAKMSSICQIGLAHYQDGRVINEWNSYINPEDYFDYVNVSIHGIDENTVSNSPTFKEVSNKLNNLLDNRIAVCHTHFDRIAIKTTSEKCGVSFTNCTWLDSARVARRTWSEFSSKGYGLKNICRFLGYDFKHHDALEDAKASGHILIAAIRESGLSIHDWLKRVKQPIDIEKSSKGAAVKRAGNPKGVLFGEVIVFTGTLEIPRREAADMASEIGCQVDANITKKTTLLIVGDQDVNKLAGHTKSSKQRKAEQLISQGADIRILRESDFKKLVELS